MIDQATLDKYREIQEKSIPLGVLRYDGIQEGYGNIPDMMLGTELAVYNGQLIGGTTIHLTAQELIEGVQFNGKALYRISKWLKMRNEAPSKTSLITKIIIY